MTRTQLLTIWRERRDLLPLLLDWLRELLRSEGKL